MTQRVVSVKRPRPNLHGVRGLARAQRVGVDARLETLDGLEIAEGLVGLILHEPVDDIGALAERRLDQLSIDFASDIPDLSPLRTAVVEEMFLSTVTADAARALASSPLPVAQVAFLWPSDLSDSRIALPQGWLAECSDSLTSLRVTGFRLADALIAEVAALPRFKELSWEPHDDAQRELGERLLGDRADAMFVVPEPPEDPVMDFEEPDGRRWWAVEFDLVARWRVETNGDGRERLEQLVAREAPEIVSLLTFDDEAGFVSITADAAEPLRRVVELVNR